MEKTVVLFGVEPRYATQVDILSDFFHVLSVDLRTKEIESPVSKEADGITYASGRSYKSHWPVLEISGQPVNRIYFPGLRSSYYGSHPSIRTKSRSVHSTHCSIRNQPNPT